MTPANGIDRIAAPAIAKRARLSWASESASIALTFGRSAAQLPMPKPLAKKIAEVPRRARHGDAGAIESCVIYFSGGDRCWSALFRRCVLRPLLPCHRLARRGAR